LVCLPQPLHIAIKEEHEEIALKLLSMSMSSPVYQVDVNICDAEGDTPLITALENDMLKVADMLIFAGADVQIKSKSIASRSLLHHYASRGAADILKMITNAATFDAAMVTEACGSLQFTPLHLAARAGRMEACEFLLPMSNIDAVDLNGKTAAELAQANRKTEVHKVIIDFKHSS
jgi:ankyrin repeat protein